MRFTLLDQKRKRKWKGSFSRPRPALWRPYLTWKWANRWTAPSPNHPASCQMRWTVYSLVCLSSVHSYESAYKQFIQIVGYNTKMGSGWMTYKSVHDNKHILEMYSFIFKLVSYVFLFVCLKKKNHTQEKFKCNDFWLNVMTFEPWAKSQLWIQNMYFVWLV